MNAANAGSTKRKSRVFAGTVGTDQGTAPRYAETRQIEALLEQQIALLREMLEREREVNRDLIAERDRLLAMLGEGRGPKLIEDQRPPWWRRWR